MAVYLTSTDIQMGLGGSFLERLVNGFSQGCWPLAETADPTISDLCRDVSGHGRNGAYVGTDITHGVATDIAEGALATTFAGGSYVEVLDDGEIQGLSLDAGDVDIIFLIKTSHNSATPRCIIGKQTTNSAGNGYKAYHVSGAIGFFLRVAGSTIFDFTRGAISDNAWHLIHCNYQTGPGEARIFIDGVQSGATVTGVTTEPAVTTAPMRIGMFTDGVAGDASGFIGTLAFMTISREGDPTIGVDLQASRLWTSVWSDVRAQVPIQTRRGIPGTKILDNIARPSSITFAMNNAATNTGGVVGYYSPGHASCRSGFTLGTPVRWSLTYGGVTQHVFRGRIKSVTPTTGLYRDRLSYVLAVGWLDVATSIFVSALESQTNIRSDQALRLVIDQAEGRSPAAIDISTGSSTFAIAFDQSSSQEDSILTELARIQSSERGYLYEKADTLYGGTVKSEGRGDRQISTTVDATFDNTMHGLEVTYSLDNVVNIVRVVVTPRRVDAAATTVLYTLDISQQSQQIAPGQTVVLEGGYRDPSNEAQHVGGTAMVTPVLGTDYGFFAQSDGGGANLGANLDVVSTLGGNSFRVELTNEGSDPGFLRLNGTTAFQLRGKGVYAYVPVTVERRDRDSVRRHGPRTVQIDLQYENSIAVAESIADFYLNILGSMRPVPDKLSLLGNHSNTLMTQAVNRDVGDKIAVVEPVSGITNDDPDSTNDVGYFINEVQMTLNPGGLLTTAWSLAPAAPAGVWVWDEARFDQTTVFGV